MGGQDAAPEKIYVDNVLENVACGGTVDIIETGFIVFHQHTNGKILENNTYHLNVTYTDGETEVFFRDRGRDQLTLIDGGLEVNVAGRTSFLYDEQNAHVGNLTFVIIFEPFSFETVINAGHDVDICGYFD